MTTSYNLLTRLNERKTRQESKLRPVRMSPFVRRLAEKRLPAKVLWNGAWTAPDDGGAA